MKLIQLYKLKIIYFFFAIMLAFKLIAVQEFIHIEQHKQEQVHQDHCSVCQTIFQIGKFQNAEPVEISHFSFVHTSNHTELYQIQYKSIFINEKLFNKLHNRPPPFCI
ncbi:hypothetical protein [Apibacter sp. HY039]|uniref:hypothetical protein n=1 Tax=Apibacter sp. HY039 TaxID=2501476 RepID=UPI000FEBEE38|nr:hypothetical protein [Apibacter sp. HY039]